MMTDETTRTTAITIHLSATWIKRLADEAVAGQVPIEDVIHDALGEYFRARGGLTPNRHTIAAIEELSPKG